MLISVLCPSRARPEKAAKMLESCLDTAVRDVEVLFYLNDDDAQRERYYYHSEEIRNRFVGKDGKRVKYHSGTDNPAGYSWNQLAIRAKGDLLMLMGDDVEFQTVGWDERYREAAKQHPDGIYVISCSDGGRLAEDGTKAQGNPHPTVSRTWVGTLGYFVNPMFLHWYIDTWNVDLAKEVNRFIYLDDVVIEHQKCGEAVPVDETCKRIRKGCWPARDKYAYEALKRYQAVDVGLLSQKMYASHEIIVSASVSAGL